MRWDRIWFDYEDFRNLEDTAAIPGEEPLYNFEADIYRLVFTLWY